MKIFLTFLLFIFALPAYAEKPQQNGRGDYFANNDGTPPKRIISIGGAITEIIYALDGQNVLIGSDTTSYFPPAAEKLPKVGYQRNLSAEGILSLNPDLIILTDEAGPPSVLRHLQSAGVRLLQLQEGRSLDDVKENITLLGKILGRPDKAKMLTRQINEQAEQLEKRTQKSTLRKKVMFILNHGGGAIMTAGKNTAAHNMIALSGAENVAIDFHGYKILTPEAMTSLSPDIILTTTQSVAQAGGKENLLKSPGMALTPAAKKGHIIAMDALFMLGFGPRSAQAALELHRAYEKL